MKVLQVRVWIETCTDKIFAKGNVSVGICTDYEPQIGEPFAQIWDFFGSNVGNPFCKNCETLWFAQYFSEQLPIFWITNLTSSNNYHERDKYPKRYFIIETQLSGTWKLCWGILVLFKIVALVKKSVVCYGKKYWSIFTEVFTGGLLNSVWFTQDLGRAGLVPRLLLALVSPRSS